MFGPKEIIQAPLVSVEKGVKKIESTHKSVWLKMQTIQKHFVEVGQKCINLKN